MKLLTLNTHSLQEGDPQRQLKLFASFLLEESPGLVAMQEVNQTRTAPPLDAQGREGCVPTPASGIPLRRDNFAANTARILRAAGVSCSWTWLPIKRGYERYDEGLALISLAAPIVQTNACLISARDDYSDWRTRKALGVRLEGQPDWFYSVHLGWWKDEDPFADQWSRLDAELAEAKAQGPVWLLGDFNAPAHVRDESYDLVRLTGWYDTYDLAAEKDSGVTVPGLIDGWRDQPEAGNGMRIDYICCSRLQAIRRSCVVYNGKRGPVVSDHYGILAEIEQGGNRHA